VLAKELLSGRVIEQICRAARQSAFLRDVRGAEAGIRLDDMDEALATAIQRLSTTLNRQNASAYLADLPQDINIVAVEPVVRRVSRGHRFMNND
jgi:hypothetical protein